MGVLYEDFRNIKKIVTTCSFVCFVNVFRQQNNERDKDSSSSSSVEA